MSEAKDKIRRNKGWDNLKPCKKGEVRNPKGRPPKDRSLTEALKEIAPQILEINIGGKKNTTKTAIQLLALGMYLKGIKGDASMAREIADRVEGKVAQPISGPGENGAFPFTLTIDKASGDK